MPEGTWILFERFEKSADKFGTFLKVYSLDGTTHKIREKRSHLWDMFQNANRFQPFLLTYDIYKGTPYVANSVDVKDEILKSATIGLFNRVIESTDNERIRYQAISCSKDLVCAEALELTGLFNYAKRIVYFVKEGKDDIEDFEIEPPETIPDETATDEETAGD